MDFAVTHHFPQPPAEVARVTLDESYQRSLHDVGALKSRELIAQEKIGEGRVSRRVRCVPDIVIPSAAKAFLGDGEVAWVEAAEWEPGELTWTWEIHPEVGRGLLTATGTIRLQGDITAERTVAGRVEVKVPLYGGKVERWIVEGIREAYDEEAARLREWLQREKA